MKNSQNNKMEYKIPKTIFGKPVEGAIKRALATNTSSENPSKIPPQAGNINLTDNVAESFIMSYDGIHKDFFQELIAKVNKTYKGTKAEIPIGISGEVQGNLVKRMGIISTITNNANLRNYGLWPITATQSEYLLKAGKLTNPENNWEDFGIILYDRNGKNPKEAQAIYDSLKINRTNLGLSESDLESKLIIVNPGAEIDSSMSHGIKPIIIPGITQIYQHEVLEKVGKDSDFAGYGLTKGLPLLNQLGRGIRRLWMPNEKKDIGLRVLCRGGDLSLSARNEVLASSYSGGRVNFARSASP